MIVELDAWYLPDTAATSYRTEHVKTLDRRRGDRRRRRARCATSTTPGCYELGGDDFRGVFRIGEFSDDVLPPYTELIRFDAGPRLRRRGPAPRRRASCCAAISRGARASNPFDRFGDQLERDLPALLDGRRSTRYHAYTFATFRMAGPAFELLASHAEWLLGRPGAAGRRRRWADRRGMQGAVVQARRRRQFDSAPLTGALADAWARAIDGLARGLCLTRRRPPSCREAGRSRARRPARRRTSRSSTASMAARAGARDRGRGTARRGALDWHDARDFDAEDWWFRTRFDASRRPPARSSILALGGIATVAEVFLNGERVLSSDSMFARHRRRCQRRLIGRRNELAIRCRALAPLLARLQTAAGALADRARRRTTTCACFGRCCSVALPASRPGRPPSARGGRCGWSGGAAWSSSGWGCVRGSTATTGVLAVRAALRALDGAGEIRRRRSSCRATGAARRPARADSARRTGRSRRAVSSDRRGQAVVAAHARRAGAVRRPPAGRRRRAASSSTPERSGSGALGAAGELERDGRRAARQRRAGVRSRRAVDPARSGASLLARAELRAALGRVAAAGMNMLRVPGIGCL